MNLLPIFCIQRTQVNILFLQIMDFPLGQKWHVQLDGNVVLTLNFKVQSKMTKLMIRMEKSKSYATFGGKNSINNFLENYM